MSSKFPDEIRALEQNLERQVKEEKKLVLQHEGLSARCSLSVRPEFVPLRQVSYDRLAEILSSQLSVSPNFSALLSRIPESQRKSFDSFEEMSKFSVTNDEALVFSDGILRIKNLNKETIISDISVNSQTISATVSGTTTEAFYVCKLLFIALWASSQAEAEWDDLASGVHRASYRSSTLSRLPINMSDFFNPLLISFLREGDGRSAATRMGLREIDSALAQFGEADFATSTIFREVDIRISRFNLRTGYHEESMLNIIPDSMWDSNVGALKISSELPFEDHVEYVNLLAEKLKV